MKKTTGPAVLVVILLVTALPMASAAAGSAHLYESAAAGGGRLSHSAATGAGQLAQSAAAAVDISIRYQVQPDITYLVADGYESKLDLYLPRGVTAPNRTLIFIHGGGWVGGSKEASTLWLVPYLERGWTVVNVEYRLGRVALAPAAVEDCRCALRWVIRNAERYNFDTSRIVVSGPSAGGHLSLTTGMLPDSAGLDRRCPGTEDLRVAAIVNWFGITDVADVLSGRNEQSYAVAWMGSTIDRFEIAARVSPLTHVRTGLPPILTIHGDADQVVPYSNAVRLHRALDDAGVPNEFHTVPAGGHGVFTRDQYHEAYELIWRFLEKHGVE